MNGLLTKISFAFWLAATIGACGQAIQTYRGAPDGSAGAALDNSHFASATDEESVIRIYRRDTGGDPIAQIDLTKFLEVEPRSPETDIEAAARVGDRIYWITSHGRNKSGKYQPSRCRVFATDIKTNSAVPTLAPIGKPYKHLLEDLIAAPQLKEFELAKAATRSPKDFGALNVEGLAATPDGNLLIGFRNPIPEGRALLVPLLNADETIHGARAKLGAPVLLDLNGLGVRDITFWEGNYIIIGGPIASGGPFKLFRWAGGNSKPVALDQISLKHVHPEAIIIYPDKGAREIQLLSDDSSDAAGEKLTSQNTFRSIWIKP